MIIKIYIYKTNGSIGTAPTYLSGNAQRNLSMSLSQLELLLFFKERFNALSWCLKNIITKGLVWFYFFKLK